MKTTALFLLSPPAAETNNTLTQTQSTLEIYKTGTVPRHDTSIAVQTYHSCHKFSICITNLCVLPTFLHFPLLSILAEVTSIRIHMVTSSGKIKKRKRNSASQFISLRAL